MPGIRGSFSPIVVAAAITLVVARAASAQPAQYTVQILHPPPDVPEEGTTTRAFEINSSGQVFGYVINNHVATPVVWANGVVAQYLTLPAGYDWASDGGHNFINDSGRIVSQVNPQGGPGYSRRIVYWDSPDSPQIVPLAPNVCGSVGGIPQEAAWGLNNAGHILVGSYDCGNLWRWNAGSDFVFQVSLVRDGTGSCANIYSFRADRSKLNDADHVAIDYGSAFGGVCPTPTKAAGILAGSTFTPLIPVTLDDGGAFGFNNHDQMTAGNPTTVKFWDGSAIVDFGSSVVFSSLNDLGEVAYWIRLSGSVFVGKLYKDGTTTDIVLPPVPDAFSVSYGGLLNSVGQLLSNAFLQPGGPFGPLLERAIIFTPRTPVITWPKPADITYGTALSATQLNATANVPGTFTYNPPAGSVLGAAAIQLLSLTFTPSDLSLYDPTTASNSIGVLSAPLTVKADDADKEFGIPVPALSASFIGLVNADGPGSLGGTLALTTSATSASPAGLYPIVPSGVSSPNYLITFVNGTLTVNRASTTMTLQVLPGTTGYLQANALVAQVARTNPGLGSPGGLVRFRDGGTIIGTAGVASGQAFVLANGLTPGTHTLTAEYLGTANFAGSTGAPGTATIRPVANSTFTMLTATTNPSALGLPAKLTARVIPLAGGTATGTVQFFESSTSILGTASVVAGVATLNTTTLTAGTHLVRAKYFGSATLAASTSPPVLITIYTGARPASTAVALVAAPNPATLGQPLTFTATVTGGATTGTVYFYADGLFVGAAAIANVGGSFKASVSLTNALSAGRHVLEAGYLGTAGFASSTSSIVTVTIQIQTTPALNQTTDEIAPDEESATPTLQ